VVVVLGHVDHGKSSILEAIKDLKITSKESGGITQHIGAYEIEIGNPPSRKASDGQRKITFIDTPGHEAFSAMRSRGAKVADIAILVVAASEGVKAQTKEAIAHIKKSGIPLIVAINKVDKPEADPERIKRELSKEEILVEGLGGEIPSVEVSAKTKQGIADLLELILLVAEMEQLKGDTSKPAEGVIIETRLDTQRGLTATLLLSNGILRVGDAIATSSCLGRVKNLENFQGISIKEALPSMPAVVVGFEGAPKIGEAFKSFLNSEQAKAFLQIPEKKSPSVFSIEPGQKVLNIILKTDVLGSLEAIEEILKGLPQEKVILRILNSEVGEINESDIKLGKGAKAVILGFRVKINPIAQNLAEREKIRITQFDVIYDLVEGVRKVMEKTMAPEIVKVVLARIKILAVFMVEKNRQVLGGRVIEGEAKKGFSAEVFRNDEKIDQGRIVNLQRNKKDAEKVIRGDECGILYEGNAKIERDDILAIFSEERRKGEL
jgi:translation initiation factor IF-2